MNVVDSCGWLEYLADGPNADFFAPAIENLATLSPRLIGFVIAMALGMALHDAWQRWRVAAAPSASAAKADG